MSFMYETHAQKLWKSEEHEKWAFPGKEDQNKEFRNRKKIKRPALRIKSEHWARNKQLWVLGLQNKTHML